MSEHRNTFDDGSRTRTRTRKRRRKGSILILPTGDIQFRVTEKKRKHGYPLWWMHCFSICSLVNDAIDFQIISYDLTFFFSTKKEISSPISHGDFNNRSYASASCNTASDALLSNCSTHMNIVEWGWLVVHDNLRRDSWASQGKLLALFDAQLVIVRPLEGTRGENGWSHSHILTIPSPVCV